MFGGRGARIVKWLFLLLLIVNLVILGWGYQSERSAATLVPVLPADLGDLRLLSEVESALIPVQLLPQDLVVSSSMPQSLPVSPETSGEIKPEPEEKSEPEVTPESEIKQEPEIKPESEQKPDPQAESQDEEGNTILPEQGEATIGNIPQELAAKNEEPAVEVEIVQNDGAESESEESQKQKVIPKKSVTLTLTCGAFGPLERGSRARSILSKLLQADIEASLRSEAHKKTIGYWVIIPPLENKGAAIKTVKELRAQGVKDIRRFFRGDQKNGISLGVFSKQGNAEKRQQELVDKGQPAEVQPRYIDAPLYWIDYRADQNLSEKMSKQLLEQYPKLKLEIYSCSSIVTPGGIF